MPLRRENTFGDLIIRFLTKNNGEQEIRRGLPEVFPRLWRYALILTSNRDAASDLAQMTCLRAIEKAHNYTPDQKLDRWLFRMAQRIWLNELRAQAVRRGQGLHAVEDIDLPDTRHDAEMNIFVRQVLSSIYELPEAQRATVMLVYVEGFTYAEAAATLDVPIGTVMSRLATARAKLGVRLNEESAAAR